MRLFSPYVSSVSASSADSLDKANQGQANGNHLPADNTADLELGNSFNNRLTHHSNGLLVNDKLASSNQNQAFDSPSDAANGSGYLEDILASPDADSANSPRRRQRRKR